MHKEPGDEVSDTTKYHNDLKPGTKKMLQRFSNCFSYLRQNNPHAQFHLAVPFAAILFTSFNVRDTTKNGKPFRWQRPGRMDTKDCGLCFGFFGNTFRVEHGILSIATMLMIVFSGLVPYISIKIYQLSP